MTYETALTVPGTYRVERGGYLLGRFRVEVAFSRGLVAWSNVRPPWSNEHSTIQSLVRRYPDATITGEE